MYAGMSYKWYELANPVAKEPENQSLPLFMTVFSSDKGTEEVTSLSSEDFFKMYGRNADYFKYGQPLIGAHNIVAAGGRMMSKRLVADDATLANVVICAEIAQESVQKKNSAGQLLWIDTGNGNIETTTNTGTPANMNVAKVKYSVSTITGADKSHNMDPYDYVLKEADKINSSTKYVLFTVADNGRGKSVKKVRIHPDYTVSKNLQFCFFYISDIEDTTVVENHPFSINPDMKYSTGGVSRNISLTKSSTMQFHAEYNAKGFNAFIDKLAEITGYSKEVLYKNDPLFGKTNRGLDLNGISIDSTGIDLGHPHGIELQSGTNGNFTDSPFTNGVPNAKWTEMAEKYFSGELTDEIYDTDIYKVDFIVDAAYPDVVKEKIAQYASFTRDPFYFRDLGTEIYNFNDVLEKVTKDSWVKTSFAADYLTTYDIVDKYSKKQIKVTMTYSLGPLLVQYFNRNVSSPLAGEFNGFVINDAIEGTINFIPRITPKVNQKDSLDQLRVNYANYYNNVLSLQSLYTSQEEYGPLVYINNVIITQMCVKAIRSYLPKIRFRMFSSGDLGAHASMIEDNVLNRFKSFFESVSMIYTGTEETISQKIFDADLQCFYKNFFQHERFKVYSVEGIPPQNISDKEKFITTEVK